MAQSIKLGNDVYLDASGVVVNGSGRKLSEGAIDISSQFVWNTTDITFTSKNIVAFYDPVSKLVTGNIEYEASSAIPTAIGWHAQIPSGYRPSSNTQQGCMYYHSSSEWQAGQLYFRSNGNVNQNITNYWQKAVCSFVYKVG